MARANVKATGAAAPRTHEGVITRRLTPLQTLRRSVLACLLFEDSFYESGESIAERIARLTQEVSPEQAASLAIEARGPYNLRHAPLWILASMARSLEHRRVLRKTIPQVVRRADELAELIAMYWKGQETVLPSGVVKNAPIPASVKKGLAAAFHKFDEYALAKYDGANEVRLRDVLFLCHAKPSSDEEAALWRRLIDGTLKAPDTWEVALSGGADKKETFTRLMEEEKLGALAFIRNLRNMEQAGVDPELIRAYGAKVKVDRVLPFRFIAAEASAPRYSEMLQDMMFRCIEGQEKLPGSTAILVDVSGSMQGVWGSNSRSKMTSADKAAALAMIAREVCEGEVRIWAFATSSQEIPDRRGFAIRDALRLSDVGHGTNMGECKAAVDQVFDYDRIIIISDMQSMDELTNPKGAGYCINVAVYQNGVGYGPWNEIDGFSAATLNWILEYERFLGEG